MTESPPGARSDPRSDERLLVHTPTGKDGELTCAFLRDAGMEPVLCRTAHELVGEIGEGAAAVIVAEEALDRGTLDLLLDALGRQPGWSDLPLIVFVRPGDQIETILEVIGTRANVTILERPVRVQTLVSAAKAAIRARRRQYQMRALLERLADADRRKDEFLATLGHELRSPLAAIRAASTNLAHVTAPEKVERQRAIIERQSHYLARLVEDLLDLSRITAGKLTLKRGPVELNDIAEHVLHVMEPVAQTRRQRLTLRRSSDRIVVDGDPVRLEQVLANLVGNALKYTAEGGAIDVWVGRDFEGATMRVADNGMGIPAGMLEQIFDPFVQLATSVPHAQGGLGLGLPLVRKLVAMHGGEIQATSDGPGRGSVFTLRLPVIAADVQPAAAVAEPTGRRRLRVLIVDDNDDLREAMKELVSLWGHEVLEAGDGEDALAQVLKLQPDVALVDLGLPLLDGFEVARRVRSAALAHPPKMVALTGYSGEASRRALEAGFDVHLVKPVDEAELERILGDRTVH